MADSSQAVLGSDTSTSDAAAGKSAPAKVKDTGPQKVKDVMASAPKVANDPTLDALGSQIDKATNAPLPDRPAATTLPKMPDAPVIKQEEWQGLGLALVGMAMMAGGTKGNWMQAASFLTGAINGYQQGNEEKAKTEFQKYQTAYQHARDEEAEKNQAYQDILKNRQLSINEMMAQYKLLAAQDQRVVQNAAADRRNLIEMAKAADEHEGMLIRLDDHNRKVNESLDPTSTMSDADKEGVKLLAATFMSGKTLPAGMFRGPDGPAYMKAVMNEVAKEGKAKGWTDDDIATHMIEATAMAHGLSSQETKRLQQSALINTATVHINAAMKSAAELGNSMPVFMNKWLNDAQFQSNDPKVAQFLSDNEIAVTETAKALNPSGVATDKGREEVRNLIRTDMANGNYQLIGQHLQQRMLEKSQAMAAGQNAAAAQITGGQGFQTLAQPAEDSANKTYNFNDYDPDAQ